MRDHPLSRLWTDFEPASDLDRLDITMRALRGFIFVHRPVTIRPVDLTEAQDFLSWVHRHNRRLQGWKFGAAVWDTVGMIGVITVGRPVARSFDRRTTLEVTRCCVMDNAPRNTVTMLYGRAIRVARELGFSRLITYTTEEESGASLRAAGFVPVATSAGGEWGRRSRPRDEADFDTGPKTRWERHLREDKRCS